MFLRNCWYVAGWSRHFPNDRLVARTLLDEPIVLYRKDDGGIAALETAAVIAWHPYQRGASRATICAACITVSGLRRRGDASKFPAKRWCRRAPGCALIRPSSRIAGCGCGWATRRSPTRR